MSETATGELCRTAGERVVAIEYDEDCRPFAVVTVDGAGCDEYDFEWCEAHGQLYCSLAGGGPWDGAHRVALYGPGDSPPRRLWVAEGVRVVVDLGRPLDDAELLAGGYERIAEPLELADVFGRACRNPFDAADECDGTVYCGVCGDRFPDDATCRHVVWCDGGYYGGCGSEDLTGPDAQRDDFWALLDRVGGRLARRIRRAVLGGRYEFDEFEERWRRIHDAARGCLDAECGLVWLVSLEAGVTADAERRTAHWIGEWLLAGGKKRRRQPGGKAVAG